MTDEEGAGLVEDAASEDHIANLEGEVKEAADQEAETAQRFDSERRRRAALDQELHEAREEAARLMLDEASQTSSAMRAEAVELLQASRVQAEREAGRVTKRAFEQANEMIAIARRDAVAIVDAGRDEVRALEDDTARRMADLDTEHQELTHRLGIMDGIHHCHTEWEPNRAGAISSTGVSPPDRVRAIQPTSSLPAGSASRAIPAPTGYVEL